ncbi:MAG: phosphonate metabolism transcriptional regulator PhnF [Rhizobium sp.]|nr:phosphonate metabolism transcriptional regulator PhnF [Rhizobium sp.]
MDSGFSIDRRSGVAAWKQIADRISRAIDAGDYDATGMVPPETQLAESFGVNRHTVRSAIAALAEDGLLRRVQGRGTLIEKRERLVYPVGRRTRFSEGLVGQAGETDIRLLHESEGPASVAVAAALGLTPGASVIQLNTLSLADGIPISLAVHYLEGGRFSGIGSRLSASRSITRALSEFGVEDYVRVSTEVTARLASPAESEQLSLGGNPVVLETAALNADSEGRPVQYSRTLFAADRIALRLDTPGK